MWASDRDDVSRTDLSTGVFYQIPHEHRPVHAGRGDAITSRGDLDVRNVLGLPSEQEVVHSGSVDHTNEPVLHGVHDVTVEKRLYEKRL